MTGFLYRLPKKTFWFWAWQPITCWALLNFLKLMLIDAGWSNSVDTWLLHYGSLFIVFLFIQLQRNFLFCFFVCFLARMHIIQKYIFCRVLLFSASLCSEPISGYSWMITQTHRSVEMDKLESLFTQVRAS